MKQGSSCNYELKGKTCRTDEYPDNFFADGFHIVRGIKRFLRRRIGDFIPFIN